jgi:hypothetical protein
MKDSITIESAENGYIVTCWKNNDDENGYQEPTKHVAADEEEVLKIVKENLQ